jgi:hypothetical protein
MDPTLWNAKYVARKTMKISHHAMVGIQLIFVDVLSSRVGDN